MSDDPLDEIEALQGMRSMAKLTRALYEELLEQGFEITEALRLTSAYLAGLAGGYRG